MELPPLEQGTHLVGYLFELGPGAEGRPSGWIDLRAWQSATGAELEEFEAVTLIDMCREYVAQFSKPNDPQPWREEIPDPVAVSDKIKQLFRGFRPRGHR